MGGVKTRSIQINHGASAISLIVAIILLAFTWYLYRVIQIESNREYSQGGLANVLRDGIPRPPTFQLRANGIGCAYWLRLRDCIGIEVLGATIPSDLPAYVENVVRNFCDVVEKKYPKEIFRLQKGTDAAAAFDAGLGRAYVTFFDCENTRKPIGEIALYHNPSGIPTRKPEWIINPKMKKIFPVAMGDAQ